MKTRCLLLLLALLGSACLDTVGNELRLPTAPLEPAVVGAPYAASLAAKGGTPPYTYLITSLPPGFSFYPGPARLEGPAAEEGTFSIELRVEDARGDSRTRSYPIEVLPRPAPDAGWEGGDGGTDGGDPDPDAGSDAGIDGGFVGDPHVLGVANWNVEWFGDPEEGPRDDALQVTQVARVITRGEAHVWALQEVVERSRFDELLQALPGHEGFVANDARVQGGAASYASYEQKPAFVWRSDALEDVRASLILAEHDYVFAGRPPLVIEAVARLDGVRRPLTFIVIHLKAQYGGRDWEHWSRRHEAILLLKAWMDAQPAEREILVLGDWNDDVDESIAHDMDGGVMDTPFRALVEDLDYRFLTQPLSEGREGTTVRYSTPIDHQLANRSLAERYVEGSLRVLRPDGWSPPISAYEATTSDHYPVRTQFLLQ